MKSNIVLILLTMLSLASFSQAIEKGNIIKDRQFLIDKSELSANDSLGNFVAIRPHNVNGTLRNYYVEFFDDLNYLNRIEIKTENDTDILKLFILKEKAFVFIKETEKRETSIRLDIIDLKTKDKSEKLLYSINKDDNSSIYKALKNDYNISLDITSDLVLSFPVIEDKKTYVFVKVFSEDLEIKSEFSVFPDESISYKNTSFLNTKQANNKIYLLFQLNNTAEDNFYKLIEINDNEQRSVELKIPDNSYELINSRILNNQMVISGLYSNVKKGGYRGFTYYNIDLNSFEVISKQNPFLNKKAENFFVGFFKGNRSIDIKDIFINDKLETHIVGQFYILRRQTVPVGIPIAAFSFVGVSGFITINPISTSYKVYDDIMIAKIDASGKLLWDTILALRQTEKITSKSNKRDNSTFTFFANNEINVLMNGFIDDQGGKFIVKQDKRRSKTNFYNIVINKNGRIIPSTIFSNADSEILFRAEKSVVSKNIIHILGQGNMRKQLLKITF